MTLTSFPQQRYTGDLDAPAGDPERVFVDAPRFRPNRAGRTIDDLYSDIRTACRHCGLKVLDGRHAGWHAHTFEPYPTTPDPEKENVT